MGLETLIIGGITAIIGIIGAFFGGRIIGASKAKSDAAAKRATEEANRIAESAIKSSEAQVKAADNASKVRDEINSLDTGDALNELRRDYARDKE